MLIEFLLLAASATQQPAAANASSATADLDKMVCKKLKETGSRLSSQKICMTKRQWDEKSRTDKEVLNELIRRQCNPGEGGSC